MFGSLAPLFLLDANTNPSAVYNMYSYTARPNISGHLTIIHIIIIFKFFSKCILVSGWKCFLCKSVWIFISPASTLKSAVTVKSQVIILSAVTWMYPLCYNTDTQIQCKARLLTNRIQDFNCSLVYITIYLWISFIWADDDDEQRWTVGLNVHAYKKYLQFKW